MLMADKEALELFLIDDLEDNKGREYDEWIEHIKRCLNYFSDIRQRYPDLVEIKFSKNFHMDGIFKIIQDDDYNTIITEVVFLYYRDPMLKDVYTSVYQAQVMDAYYK